MIVPKLTEVKNDVINKKFIEPYFDFAELKTTFKTARQPEYSLAWQICFALYFLAFAQ